MIPVIRLFLYILAFALGSAAAAAPADCFQNEIDPSTKRPYQNHAQWRADRDDLWAKAPAAPSIFRLYRGYEVAKAESRERGVGSDKRRHCYVGCRIANDIGPDVAEYAGYYKEDEDLLDCNPKTHFDHKDIAATLKGVEIANQKPQGADKAYCKEQCRAELR